MPFLKRTTKEKQKHYHIVYLREDNSGVTSGIIGKGEEHTHEVLKQEEGDFWQILIANGHTHQIEEYPTKVTEEKPDKDTAIAENYSLWNEARGEEKEARTHAQEAEDFYEGDQWDEDIKTELKGAKRAILTKNKIESKIDLLSGYQRQNRFDIRYIPVEDGDALIADILTIVIKNICDQNNFEFHETDVFEDEAITGRGLFNMYIDYDEDIRGKIVIEQFPWKEVKFGPHNKKDCSDLEYLIKEKWFSKARIQELWPDKAEDVQEEMKYAKEFAETRDNKPGGSYDDTEETKQVTFGGLRFALDFVDIQKQNFKVLERWSKKYKRVYIIANSTDDFVFNADGWEQKDINAVKTIPGFTIIPRIKTQIRKVVTAGGVLLEDTYPDLPDNDFCIVAVYAKKRRNTFWGKVKPLIDLQKEINKRSSQASDIVNRVAAYGWFYDETTFPTPQEEKTFVKKAGTPGFKQKVTDINRRPVKEEGIKFPNEIVGLIQINDAETREISNVNLDLQGMNSRAESGIAILEKKQQGLVGNEFLFDNLRLAKKIIARKLVKYVQYLYTPERIMRIVDNQNQRNPVELGGQPLYPPNQDMNARRQAILQLLQNADLTKYDVAISESAYSPTTKRANFIMWSQMAQSGIPVPPAVLVDLSDLPEKEKVKQAIAQMMQSQAQAEKMKYDTEIAKTQINAQAKQGGIQGQ